MVRRLGGRLDHLSRVLPDRAAGGLRLFRPRRASAGAARRWCACTPTLLVVSLVVLPIIPALHWKPAGTENPSWLILGHARRDDRSSLLPAVDDEPAGPGVVRPGPARRRARTGCSRCRISRRCWRWSATRSCSSPGRRRARRRSAGRRVTRSSSGCARRRAGRACGIGRRRGDHAFRRGIAVASGSDPGERPPPLARQTLWCTLAATGSLLLLGVSNHVTQNIAAVPLLWIAPLAIYLLTFILCFDGKGWYRRETFLAMVAAGLPVMAWTLADPKLTHELDHPDRRVLRRALPRLHVLPRRAGPPEAGAEVPDALLPDGLAGRRDRLGAGRDRRAAGAARLFRARRRAGPRRRCSCSGRCAARTSCSACSRSRRCSRPSAAPCGRCASSTRTRSSPRAISTACCA